MNLLGQYVLRGKKAVQCDSIQEWSRWLATADYTRVVAQTGSDVRVSTVFLGIDHSYGGNVPLLFETMVFGGVYDQEEVRYATWEQAESGHVGMVKKVFGVEDGVLVIWKESET